MVQVQQPERKKDIIELTSRVHSVECLESFS